jgi:hypothetical protein
MITFRRVDNAIEDLPAVWALKVNLNNGVHRCATFKLLPGRLNPGSITPQVFKTVEVPL